MSDISPVLASFLAGQGGQLDLIKQAQSVMQSKEVNKLRQQEITNQLKYFDQMAKHEENMHDLEMQTHNLNRQKAYMSAVNDVRTQLANGSIPMQGQTNQVAAPAQPGDNMTRFTNQFMANPTQTVDTGDQGFGKITVPTPETDTESAIAKQKAMMPGILDLFTREHQITNKYDMSKLEESQRLRDESATNLANVRGQFQETLQGLRNEQNDKQIDSKIQMAGLRNQLAFNNQMSNMFGPGITDPSQAAELIKQTATQHAMGNLDKSEIPSHLIPAVNTFMQKNGLVAPPGGTKFRAGVTGDIEDANSFLNTIDSLKSQLKSPTNLSGQIGNIAAEKFGISGMSPYKSAFDMMQISQLPKMDVALGLTPGALSRSPKLLDKIKSLLPLPGDDSKMVTEKEFNGADMFFSAAARKLSALPIAQRMEYWKDIVKDNAQLIQRNPMIAEKLIKAKTTGKYEPGSLVRDWVTSVGGKL